MIPALAVFDTMIFLQAAVHPNRTYTTFQAVSDGRLILCTSAKLLAEVEDVLSRRTMAVKFPALTPTRIAGFLREVNAVATFFPDVPSQFTWPDHPDDDHLFNLAIHSSASWLLTWETRILRLPALSTPTATLLRQLAPNLAIATPPTLAQMLRSK